MCQVELLEVGMAELICNEHEQRIFLTSLLSDFISPIARVCAKTCV